KHARATVTIERSLRTCIDIALDHTDVKSYGHAGIEGDFLKPAGGQPFSLLSFRDIAGSLAKSLYIGPFRNAINVGTKSDYLDIQIGQSFIGQFRQWKTGNEKKSNDDIAKLINDIKTIFQFDSLEIGPSHDDQSLHFNANGRPYKQHELG